MEKERKHLPIFGIGPFLCFPMAIITAVAIALSVKGIIPYTITIKPVIYVFAAIGIFLIMEGIICFIGANFVSGLIKNIKSNKLKTDGSYAFVRNPCYAMFFLGSTGAILIAHNWLLLILPVVFWTEMTIVLKNTEEKWLTKLYGQEYIAYRKKVNRCIPWFPRK